MALKATPRPQAVDREKKSQVKIDSLSKLRVFYYCTKSLNIKLINS